MTQAVYDALTSALGRAPDHVELIPTMEYNEVYRARLGDETVFFKADRDLPRLASEAVLYDVVAREGLPGPRLLHMDLDQATYPEPFFIVESACGIPLDLRRLDAAEIAKVMEDLARYLRALHAIAVEGFGAFELDALREGRLRGSSERPSALSGRAAWSLDYLEERGLVPSETADLIREKVSAAEGLFETARPATLHADLGEGHVYIDPGRLKVTALIDWGDTSAGDVVWDFCPLAARNRELADILIRAYASEDGTLDAKLEIAVLLRFVGASRWLHERAPLDPEMIETIEKLARA